MYATWTVSLTFSADFDLSTFPLCRRMKTTMSYFLLIDFPRADLLAAQIFLKINGFVMIDSYITEIWFVTSRKADKKNITKKTNFWCCKSWINKIMMEVL